MLFLDLFKFRHTVKSDIDDKGDIGGNNVAALFNIILYVLFTAL